MGVAGEELVEGDAEAVEVGGGLGAFGDFAGVEEEVMTSSGAMKKYAPAACESVWVCIVKRAPPPAMSSAPSRWPNAALTASWPMPKSLSLSVGARPGSSAGSTK